MKRTTLITLICSMLAAVVLLIGVLFVTLVADEPLSEEKNALVIASASASAVYNGETLFDDEWYLSQGDLKEGHALSVSVTGSQKNVGVSENYVAARVLDGNGADVTAQYDIEYKPGILNVKEREICLIADSEMKLYDGTPLTSDKYTVESAISLLPTDTVEATVEGSITEVGEEKNRITAATIYNDVGEDVTRNYSIKTIDGKLIVYSSDALVFESDDDVKEYDGTPLTNDNWKLVSGALEKDHTVQVSVFGSQTEVGDSENTFTVRILDENGEDVTDTYEVVCRAGTLNVIPAEVTVISNSNQKQYDGTPLTDAGFTTDPEYYSGLFRFEPVIVGSQTEVGSSENTVTDCRVYQNDTDVTHNFVLVYECGVLEVVEAPLVQPKLVFASMDGEKIYDGQPLTNQNWALLEGELLEGHTPTVTVTGSITDAGICDNVFMVSIGDFSGNDVTDQYIIENRYGTLTVHKQPLKVTSDSAQKVYDGEPLTASGYKVTEESVAKLYTFECQIVGSRTEVGTGPNTIANCYVFNSEGIDVSANFDIEKEEGTLTVVENEENIKPELTYQSGSDDKIYDGTPLTCNQWERVSGELKSGHREVVTVIGSITRAGKIDNEYTVTILDANGNDVTEQYVIIKNCGTLLVEPKHITITANSAFKMYDGTPLTDSGYTVRNTDETDTSPSIPTGDTPIVHIIGSITEPGEIDNTISSVDVQGADGQSVKDSYVITVENGRLRVTDGSEDVKPTGEVYFYITSTKDDTVYLKQTSMGNYDPTTDGWSAAPEYGEYINGTTSAYYLPSFAINNVGERAERLDIDSVKGFFAMPYYSSATGSTFLQTSDVTMQGETNAIYTAYYYSKDSVTGVSLPKEYAAYEDAYAEFVKENYLYVDDETYAYMRELIQKEGFDRDDADILSKVAKYIKKSAEYDMEYDRAVDRAENPVIAFLETYQVGVCRHYAKAATLLYRSLGIPARYTVGFMGQVKADETVAVTDAQGHAWVEVYVENIGWVKVEVTGSSSQIALTVKPVDTLKKYDGTEFAAEQRVSIVSVVNNADMSQYVLEAVVEGSRSELGITETEIKRLIIKDLSGNVVYDSEAGIGLNKFKITYDTGKLHVYRSHLTFTSVPNSSSDKTYEKIYDGEALTGELSDIRQTGGTLHTEEGYECVITPTASITNVGVVANSYTVKLYKDGKDVTDHYYITRTYGTLTVKTREITIAAASAEEHYSPGSTLVRNDIVYDPSDIAPTDRIDSFQVEGSQANIGYSANVVRDVVIKNEAGENVTSNYQITFIDGTLKIIP